MPKARKTNAKPSLQTEAAEGYRVVYGETMPAWEQVFPTLGEAVAFAERHRSFGDVIFSITKVDPRDPGPHSLTAALALAEPSST